MQFFLSIHCFKCYSLDRIKRTNILSFSSDFKFSFIVFGPKLVALLLPGKGEDVGETLVKSLQNTKYSIDEKLEKSFISLFSRKPNSSNVPNNAKDTDEDPEDIHDKQYQTGEEINADGLGEKHVAEDLDNSESSDEDGDAEKGKKIKSGSDSDEDNVAEHVEFNDGRLRRKAIFGNDVDHGDLKVLNAGYYCFYSLDESLC